MSHLCYWWMKPCSGIPTSECSTVSAFIRHISKPSLTRITMTGGQQGTIMDVSFKSELSSLVRFILVFASQLIHSIGCAAEAPKNHLLRVTSRDSLNRHFHYTTYSSHRFPAFWSTLSILLSSSFTHTGHTQHFQFPRYVCSFLTLSYLYFENVLR
jgi:hypothetical protein